AARLERYDRLVYQSAPQKLPAADDGLRELEVIWRQGQVTVRLHGKDDTLTIFDRRTLDPIPGRHRLGLLTWGPDTAIARLELEEPR
ncbi:MAG: hypothetical protein KDB18_04330, partial [Salinibacterium sp.]|nr:hypothetical protein [Salinibacterium sp.]